MRVIYFYCFATFDNFRQGIGEMCVERILSRETIAETLLATPLRCVGGCIFIMIITEGDVECLL